MPCSHCEMYADGAPLGCLNGCVGAKGGDNPNRPNGPWYRCYQCGGLWDRDKQDLLALYPDLRQPVGSEYNQGGGPCQHQ